MYVCVLWREILCLFLAIIISMILIIIIIITILLLNQLWLDSQMFGLYSDINRESSESSSRVSSISLSFFLSFSELLFSFLVHIFNHLMYEYFFPILSLSLSLIIFYITIKACVCRCTQLVGFCLRLTFGTQLVVGIRISVSHSLSDSFWLYHRRVQTNIHTST